MNTHICDHIIFARLPRARAGAAEREPPDVPARDVGERRGQEHLREPECRRLSRIYELNDPRESAGLVS